jgi:hypothetical protein
MIAANGRKALLAVLMLAFAGVGRITASYDCGQIGSKWICEWSGEPYGCSYFEYECQNTCETTPFFNCTDFPGQGTSGRCQCGS